MTEAKRISNRKSYLKRRDKVLARMKEYYRTKLDRAKKSLREKEYRRNNREKMRENGRRHYLSHRDTVLAQQKTYREGSVEHRKEYQHQWYFKNRLDRIAKSYFQRVGIGARNIPPDLLKAKLQQLENRKCILMNKGINSIKS